MREVFLDSVLLNTNDVTSGRVLKDLLLLETIHRPKRFFLKGWQTQLNKFLLYFYYFKVNYFVIKFNV